MSVLDLQRLLVLAVYQPPGPKRTSSVLPAPKEFEHVALESRVLAGYVAGASMLMILAQAAFQSSFGRMIRQRLSGTYILAKSRESMAPTGTYLSLHGGWVIILYQALRLVANMTLVVLVIMTALFSERSAMGDVALIIASSYAAVLSVLLLYVPVIKSGIISFHATLAALAVFASYSYRDIWPLLTFTLDPADGHEGLLLWAKIVVAAIAGIFIPMFEPYVYVPLDPSNTQKLPNSEQTASLVQLLTFSFMNGVMYGSPKVDHLSLNMLEPQLDTDNMAALKPKAFRYLDPFQNSKRKISIYKAVFGTFAGMWLIQAILTTLNAFAILGSPVGLNRLLAHIESPDESKASVKPWVWILFIALAPLITNFTEQLYSYYNTRTATQMEAVITAAIYQHSLRVRVITHADDSAAPASTVTPELPKIGTAQRPTPSPGAQNTDASTLHSRAESSATTATVMVSENSGDKDKKGTEKDNKKNQAKDLELVGHLNSLITADLENITNGKDWLIATVNSALQLTLASLFLYSILGWAALVGLATMVLLLPVPAWVSKFMNTTQKRKMAATDARVSYIKEVLNILRMIKQFGWETKVKDQINLKRDEELELVFRRKMLSLLNLVVSNVVPLLHMVVTLVVYTLVMKRPLKASVIFSALTGFNMLAMTLYMFIFFVPQLINANVSLRRVEEFLNSTELLDHYNNQYIIEDSSMSHSGNIGLGHATFFWSVEHSTDDTDTSSRQKFRLRIEDDITFKQGALNLIVGPTGCGKTSLLMALLGEMHYVPSGPGAWRSLPRQDGVAYCAQEAWVQSVSIKDNILFGAPFDEARYKKVIYQCGLKRDLSLFNAGDLTEVGEKGLTLSGGQKARISLARAVYSSAQIILLDDILAALDVHTSVWIVTRCLKGDLLAGRTVLLVTHNAALTSPVADFIVSLGTDGRILSQGKPVDNVIADKALAEEIGHVKEAIKLEVDLEEHTDDGKAAAQGSKLVVAEEIQAGHVSWKSITLMAANLSSWPLLWWCGYTLGCFADEAAEVFEIWWLGHWAAQYTPGAIVDVIYYMSIYIGIALFIIATYMWVFAMTTFASIRVGRVIHKRLIDSVMAATFRWLDVTPTSRIIARCTQDIQSVDGPLMEIASHFMAQVVAGAARLIAIAFSAPIFVVPGFVIGAIGVTFGKIFLKAQLSLKRERSNAKAPVVAAFNGAFSGLTSIRAYGAEEMFTTQTMEKVDTYTQVSIVFYNVNRWVAVRIQALSAAFAGGLAFYLVYRPGGSPRSASKIGFTLNMAVMFTRQLLGIVRVWNMLEVESNSLERIQGYLDIEKEPVAQEGGVPPAYWPASGKLVVKDLCARYSVDGPLVLDKVSFELKSGERVGIVGRTGSGKSTLTLALLRCIVTEGEIYYDGVPTQSLNLDALRSNITIIPQAPELISGTLRKNLDMFDQHNDTELNDALRSAGLFSLQTDADENRLTLDSQIAASGGNLSVGQRQIIALARAIVRQSKLLVLDEATSAIDYETDAVIQSSLRTQFSNDVTVLTVAHRLQTVMDCDKIMVLDAGKLVEFDSPKMLLAKEGGFLRALVDESADKDALYALANGSDS